MTQAFNSSSTSGRALTPRKSKRVGLAAGVFLRRTGHGNYRVKIYDLSPEGCKTEFVERPELDELVWVKFDDLQSLEATVCWIRGTEVGLEFVRSIHSAVFAMLAAKLLW